MDALPTRVQGFVFELPHIKVLHLQSNFISKLPAIHNSRCHLTTLWLSDNPLCAMSGRSELIDMVRLRLPCVTDLRMRTTNDKKRPIRSNSLDGILVPNFDETESRRVRACVCSPIWPNGRRPCRQHVARSQRACTSYLGTLPACVDCMVRLCECVQHTIRAWHSMDG